MAASLVTDAQHRSQTTESNTVSRDRPDRRTQPVHITGAADTAASSQTERHSTPATAAAVAANSPGASSTRGQSPTSRPARTAHPQTL
ncbi:hypothetical protein Ae263Ps1_6263 [Pseudonocardia sp. Ae263_Ps1]|nr:hypothetical protein Ae263Ps1_6263 [Pseudonocardia sp. Ae263_Ps1]OLL89258.1 hypothetical protein Ae356Ps1_6177c [Pseudonocardia sp. Ae356_Ps1]